MHRAVAVQMCSVLAVQQSEARKPKGQTLVTTLQDWIANVATVSKWTPLSQNGIPPNGRGIALEQPKNPTGPCRMNLAKPVWLKIKRSEGQTAGILVHVSTYRSGNPFWNSGFLVPQPRVDSSFQPRPAFRGSADRRACARAIGLGTCRPSACPVTATPACHWKRFHAIARNNGTARAAGCKAFLSQCSA